MIARLVALLAVKDRAKEALHNAQEAIAVALVRLVIKLVAAVLVLIAFIYGTIALYLGLATIMEAWAAMGIVAGAVLVLGIIVLLLSGGGGREPEQGHGHDTRGGRRSAPPPSARQPAPPPAGAGADPMAAMAARGGEIGVALHDRLRRNPEAAMAAAVAAGFVIGRSPSMRKLLLAGISAALGAKASHD